MTAWRSTAVVFALVVTACGGGVEESVTTTPVTESGSTAASPAATAATAATTIPPATTTTTPPATSQAATTITVSAPPLPLPELVTFMTGDGLTLEGTVFGAGDVAVVLGAMGLEEMETWFSFAETLASAGFTAFAYNMRGHGDSEGGQMPFHVDTDAQAAIDFVRQRGAQRVFFFGASVNGAASIAVGAENDLAGVANLSGPSEVDGVDALALAPRVEEPKLFIVAEGDVPIPGMIQEVFDNAPDPKELVIFSGEAHGTELFAAHGDAVTALLLDFARSN